MRAISAFLSGFFMACILEACERGMKTHLKIHLKSHSDLYARHPQASESVEDTAEAAG